MANFFDDDSDNDREVEEIKACDGYSDNSDNSDNSGESTDRLDELRWIEEMIGTMTLPIAEMALKVVYNKVVAMREAARYSTTTTTSTISSPIIMTNMSALTLDPVTESTEASIVPGDMNTYIKELELNTELSPGSIKIYKTATQLIMKNVGTIDKLDFDTEFVLNWLHDYKPSYIVSILGQAIRVLKYFNRGEKSIPIYVEVIQKLKTLIQLDYDKKREADPDPNQVTLVDIERLISNTDSLYKKVTLSKKDKTVRWVNTVLTMMLSCTSRTEMLGAYITEDEGDLSERHPNILLINNDKKTVTFIASKYKTARMYGTQKHEIKNCEKFFPSISSEKYVIDEDPKKAYNAFFYRAKILFDKKEFTVNEVRRALIARDYTPEYIEEFKEHAKIAKESCHSQTSAVRYYYSKRGTGKNSPTGNPE
jgi:hypothetical protein